MRLEKTMYAASALIAALLILLMASAVRAETYQELQARYEKVEVGIAPGENAENVQKGAENVQKGAENVQKGAENVSNPYQTIPISDAEFEELRWVLALAAQGEGFEGELLCCEVIFNRVLSPKNWGAGVHGVLSKKGQFTEYRYIGKKSAWAVPGEMEDDVISECLWRGPSMLPDMKYVYFDTGKRNGSRNIKRGNHWFGAEK